jgi:hypothetical protein
MTPSFHDTDITALVARLRERPCDIDPNDCARAADALEALQAARDASYEERNKVVAALARLFPSGIAKTAIPGWLEDWHGCVYIDLPTGQVSWHYHDSQADLFEELPAYNGQWDGHDTPEKYRRLASLAGDKP